MPNKRQHSSPQFARRLRELRKSRGLSQYALAKAADITQRTLQPYESGERIPAADVAFRLANALGVTVNDLFAE